MRNKMNAKLILAAPVKVSIQCFLEKSFSNKFLCSVSDYGLFVMKDENDKKSGYWLDPNRQLQYYILRDGVY